MRSASVGSGGQVVTGKNPTVALVISIFLGAFGGGQFYNGDWKKGLAMAAATILLAIPSGGLAQPRRLDLVDDRRLPGRQRQVESLVSA